MHSWSQAVSLPVTGLCQDAGSRSWKGTCLMMAEQHPKSGVLLKRQRADAQEHAQDVTVGQRALKQGPSCTSQV